MKVFELHVSELNELQAQRHFHAHCCALAMDVCFTVKLVVDDIFATVGIPYKYADLFINFFDM
jgi:hypothetical protein